YDLTNWNYVSEVLLRGENPYATTTYLNWPPLWMQLLFVFQKIARTWHVPFDDVVRSFLIATESAVALVLYATIKGYAKSVNAARLLIFGVALNPIFIFQVCQHANLDMLMAFWIVLAVYMVLRFQEQHEARFWLCACFALGMGALTKTVPLALS